MKLIVKPHTIEIVKDLVNEKEIDITKCEFEFADEITDDYVKEAYFTYNGTTYKQIIQNNECKIPYEVLENKGMVEIGVVAYKLENDEYVKRYNPSPAYFNSLIGSLKEQYENSEPITPTDKEQIEQALNDGLNDIQNAINEVDDKIIEVNDAIEETNNLNIDVNKVDKEATIELTKKDGTQKEVKIYDGVSLQFMWQGTSLGIKTDDMQDYVFVNLQGIQGMPGPQGEPFRIKKTYSSVAEMNADFNNMNYGDYVMIASTVEEEDNAKLYTRGELQWIFITDFSGATGIKGETGATPNIQIGNVTSGDTPNVTRTGTNENPILNFTLVKGDKGLKGDRGDVGLTGNGISSVRKTSTSGLIDTYTITFTNGTTTTFDITNGEDGEVTQEQLDKVQAELDYYKMLENALPKVEGEGESITLEDTAKCPMKIGFKGQIQQDSYTGKNKLNVDTSFEEVGVIGTPTNGGLLLTGTATTSRAKAISNTPISAGNYTATIFFVSGSHTSNRKLYLDFYNGAKKIGSLEFSNSSLSLPITLEQKATSTRFGFQNGDTFNSFQINIQIESGSSSTEWEKYTGGSPSPSPDYPQPIHIVSGDNEITIQNKNYLHFNDNSTTSSGVTTTILNNDITISGTNTNMSAHSLLGQTSNLPKLQKGATYIFSSTKSHSGIYIQLNYKDTNDKEKSLVTLWGTSTTFVVPNDFKEFIRLFIGINANVTAINLNFKLQIEKGNQATSYVEHKEYTKEINLGELEVGGIGEYEDEFFKNTIDSEYYDSTLLQDKWYLKKRIRKVTFDGSEGFSNNFGTNLFRHYGSKIADYPFIVGYGLSNYFKYNSIQSGINNGTTNGDFVLQRSAGGSESGYAYTLFFKNTDYDNPTDFKLWLSTHNTNIYYPLAIPENILLNDTLQETLDSFYSWQEQTNISQSNNDLPFVIKASAIRDMTKIYDI